MANNKRRNIFVTGGTGFLGSNLLKKLLIEKENHVYVLVRIADNISALQRKHELIHRMFLKSSGQELAQRIHILVGDISKDNLGLSKEDLIALRNVIDTAYHCAAICNLRCAISEVRKVNVRGTENLLKLALDWQNNGRLENVNHISTAYVAGNFSGIFYEHQIDVSQDFNNSYERSKFEAELVVTSYRNRGLRVDTYRPSIIVDTLPPSTDFAPGFLRLLMLFVLEFFDKIPADDDTKINLIPVDAVVNAIYLISSAKNRLPNQNYHIVNPKGVGLGTLLDISSECLGFKRPKSVPVSRFSLHALNIYQRKIIEPFMPYLNQKLSFDNTNAASVLNKYNFAIPSINRDAVIKTLEHYRVSGLIPDRIKKR